ncbi:MAG: hypothetical protein HS116_14675 [Planctomycetes bacterium]|nr:hypothetical protein [Planctomycetota bacterium]
MRASWSKLPKGIGRIGLLLIVAFLVLAAAVVVMGFNGRAGAPPVPPAAMLVWEAESARALAHPLVFEPDREAAHGAVLAIPLGAGKAEHAPPAGAEYMLDVPVSGTYALWVRAWWTDGCANSVAASVDDGEQHVLGNDGTYHAWHWVEGPDVQLKAGAQRLKLYHREDGIKLDQFALVPVDSAYVPVGLLPTQAPDTAVAQLEPPPSETIPVQSKSAEPRTEAEAPAVAEPREAPAEAAPVQPPEPAPPPEKPRAKPFVAGIAGCYRDGFEGHLVSLGIPYVRLYQHELEDPEKLKDIDLLVLSDPRANSTKLFQTLYAFLKSGKTVVMEILPNERAPQKRDDPEDLFLQLENRQGYWKRGFLLADDSRFFTGVPKERSYHEDVRCNGLPLATRAPGAQIFGRQASHNAGNVRGGALLVREVGAGKLYYMGLPAAFAAMWRERQVDPFVVNILRDALQDRYPFAYERFAYAPADRAAVRLSDDFMRTPGEKGGWKVLSGRFTLTGEAGGGEEAFAVRATGPAWSAAGQETWRDYRTMAAVKLLSGEAGIWQSTPDGGQLSLTLREGGAEAVLALHYPDKVRTLGSAQVPVYAGWRRLALFRRDGKTQGFVDGARVLEVADAPDARGRTGLCAITGDACFDDVRIVDTALLTPGRDVAPDEESSERCMDRYYQRCFEKLSVYAPQWFLTPDPGDPSRLNIPLPLYAGGTLEADGERVALPAGPDLPGLKWPQGHAPARDLALHTAGWKDFQFAGRVTDWYAGSGRWGQVNRWSCSPDYLWYGGESRQDAVLWYKHEVSGPVAVEALMAPRADARYGEEIGRDLDLVLFGNGKDLSQGYQFTVLSESDGCRVTKNGKTLGEARGIGLPAGHALHHSWFSVAAHCSGRKLRFYFDRRLVLEIDDPDPLTRGQLGVWTQKNKISLARCTLSLAGPDGK